MPTPFRHDSLRLAVIDTPCATGEGLLLLLRESFEVLRVNLPLENSIQRIQLFKPNVVLIFADELHFNSYEGLSAKLRQLPTKNILLFGVPHPNENVSEMIASGIRGVISNQCSTNTMFASIRAVERGELWFERTALADAIQKRSRLQVHLTPRELEITYGVSKGMSNKCISLQLGISEKTVKRHLANIFERLGVSSRLELAMLYAEQTAMPPRIGARSEGAGRLYSFAAAD